MKNRPGLLKAATPLDITLACHWSVAGSHPLEEKTAYVRFSDCKIEHCNTDGNTFAEVGIEPGAFEMVAQCLNHQTTRLPSLKMIAVLVWKRISPKTILYSFFLLLTFGFLFTDQSKIISNLYWSYCEESGIAVSYISEIVKYKMRGS